jgi:hypothetical protein
MSWVVGLPYNSYKHITNAAWVRARLCKLQKGCTRLAAASDKAYQLLAFCLFYFCDCTVCAVVPLVENPFRIEYSPFV